MAATFRAAVDGGSRGNPGPAAWAVAVLDESGRYVEGRAGTLGRATNNVAEYRALIEALRLARERRAPEVEILADSELIVRQVRGQYKVRQPHLRELYDRVRELASSFKRFQVRHVRREENVEADRLVNVALDEAVRRPGETVLIVESPPDVAAQRSR